MAPKTENEASKVAVPPQFHPPEHGSGMFSSIFRSSVGVLRTPTPLQGSDTLERHNLETTFLVGLPEQVAPSFMPSGTLATAHATYAELEERKRADERFVLQQLLAALDARLAALDAELADIDARMAEIRQQREDIGNSLEALDDLDELRAKGLLDPNNPSHARLLHLAGISPDEATRDDLASIITQRRRTLGDKDSKLETEWNAYLKRRDEIVREREAVIAARREIENADTQQAFRDAEARAVTILGVQEIGEAAFETTSNEAKAN